MLTRQFIRQINRYQFRTPYLFRPEVENFLWNKTQFWTLSHNSWCLVGQDLWRTVRCEQAQLWGRVLHLLHQLQNCIPGENIEKEERQVEVLCEHLAIFFLFPTKKFLPISFKFQLLETSPQKQKEQRQKQLDVSFFWCLFPSCTFWILCSLLLPYCLHFAKFVCLLKRLQRLKQEWQKSSAGARQTDGKNLVWFGEIEEN